MTKEQAFEEFKKIIADTGETNGSAERNKKHMSEETKNLLIKKLKTVSGDEDFLLSIINLARGADERMAIIDFIDNGEDVTYENLLLLALTMYEKHENAERF